MSSGVTGWDLYSTLQQQSFEYDFWRSAQPMACPRCGEPMRSGPPRQPGVLYCLFDFFQYPRDWDETTMNGM